MSLAPKGIMAAQKALSSSKPFGLRISYQYILTPSLACAPYPFTCMIIADVCRLLGRLVIFSKVGIYGQQKIKEDSNKKAVSHRKGVKYKILSKIFYKTFAIISKHSFCREFRRQFFHYIFFNSMEVLKKILTPFHTFYLLKRFS